MKRVIGCTCAQIKTIASYYLFMPSIVCVDGLLLSLELVCVIFSFEMYLRIYISLRWHTLAAIVGEGYNDSNIDLVIYVSITHEEKTAGEKYFIDCIDYVENFAIMMCLHF